MKKGGQDECVLIQVPQRLAKNIQEQARRGVAKINWSSPLVTGRLLGKMITDDDR